MRLFVGLVTAMFVTHVFQHDPEQVPARGSRWMYRRESARNGNRLRCFALLAQLPAQLAQQVRVIGDFAQASLDNLQSVEDVS